MPDPTAGELTALLREMGGDPGNNDVVAEALPRLYADLRRLAASYLRRERVNHTLQPTALVHEAYMKMADQSRVHWRNRSHFMGVAAQLMRRILVDHARSQQADKRGGGETRVPLDENIAAAPSGDVNLIDLDHALTKLASIDARQARIVDLRYFGGLSLEETAEAMDLSTATVKREWQMARAWLHRALQPA
jgi:RNA polymerase sigma-70 factor (ECF subfamily)